MAEIFQILQHYAGQLFAATILLVVFFLIARVLRTRQVVALAFALMPLFAVIALSGYSS